MALAEALDRLDRVGRNPEDDRTALLVIGAVVAHAARLGRAARRVGLRVEVEDGRLATEVRQLHCAAVLVRQLEVGGLVALFDHGREDMTSKRRAGLAGAAQPAAP